MRNGLMRTALCAGIMLAASVCWGFGPLGGGGGGGRVSAASNVVDVGEDGASVTGEFQAGSIRGASSVGAGSLTLGTTTQHLDASLTISTETGKRAWAVVNATTPVRYYEEIPLYGFTDSTNAETLFTLSVDTHTMVQAQTYVVANSSTGYASYHNADAFRVWSATHTDSVRNVLASTESDSGYEFRISTAANSLSWNVTAFDTADTYWMGYIKLLRQTPSLVTSGGGGGGGSLTGVIASSDTFTGSQGTLLSAHTGDYNSTWTQPSGWGTDTDLEIDSGGRVRTSAANFSAYMQDTTPADADYTVEGELYQTGTQLFTCGYAARMVSAVQTYIGLRVESDGKLWLREVTNGSIGASDSWTISPTITTSGDTITLRLVVEGTTATGYADGVQRVQLTGLSNTSTGKAGLVASSTIGTGIRQTSFILKD